MEYDFVVSPRRPSPESGSPTAGRRLRSHSPTVNNGSSSSTHGQQQPRSRTPDISIREGRGGSLSNRHHHRESSPLSGINTTEFLVEEAVSCRRRADEAEAALVNERRLSTRLQGDLRLETQSSRQAEQRLEESSRKHTHTSVRAEKAERELTVCEQELSKLKTIIYETQEQLATALQERDELSIEATNLRCECNALKTELVKSRETFEEESATLERSNEEFSRQTDDLKTEAINLRKKHEAAMELAKAHHLASKNELEEKQDALKVEVAELSTTLEDAVSQCERSREEVRRLEEDLQAANQRYTTRVNELEAVHALKVSELDRKVHGHISHEGTLEHHIDVLLSRSSALQNSVESQQQTIAKQKAEIERQKDLNHVLAIKLKAAQADSEAALMESETRRILTRQNEEMERQLQELRRTITDLMARR